MCGIVGIVAREKQGLEAIVLQMADAMKHRGPDDFGTWADDQLGIAFGQRRLSILDLTEHGRQPMHTPCGRYTINYNGEVYNYLELGKVLSEEGRVFQSRSDTEVVLAAVAAWGFEAAISKLNGMFAIAIFDREQRVLHLARDHLGIKPLYFGWNRGTFFFTSELKPLLRNPALELEIDRSALALYFRYNYVPAPHSIYRGVYKLLPGCTLSLPLDRIRSIDRFSPWPEDPEAATRPRRFWNPKLVCESSLRLGWDRGEGAAIEELESLLSDSVRRQMISDVPLGVFLSGGVDSSTVAALARNVSDTAVKTFAIGFEEERFNEAPFAAAVARHLGTEHTELYIRGGDALSVVPAIPRLYDEPFSDSSQIPTFLVAKLARSKVTVALSGDGGDELFGGYDRYPAAEKKWRAIERMPLHLRKAAAIALEGISTNGRSERLYKFSRILRESRPASYYAWLMSHWKKPLELVRGAADAPVPLTSPDFLPGDIRFIDAMMYLDTISYLPDDLLVKGDRASMGVSLEVRVPLLDFRIVELAWRFPPSLKLRNGVNKWILRQVLYRHVPESLLNRPKKGFTIPVASWLRGPLRDWAEDLLDPLRMEQDGYLNPAPVRAKWREHLTGQRDWDAELWDVLMFQSWFREYRADVRLGGAALESP